MKGQPQPRHEKAAALKPAPDSLPHWDEARMQLKVKRQPRHEKATTLLPPPDVRPQRLEQLQSRCEKAGARLTVLGPSPKGPG